MVSIVTSCSVRRASGADIQPIVKNVLAMAYEGSKENLDPDVVFQGVSNLFQKPELGSYIVAEQAGKIIGSLVIVYEWSDWRNGLHWWIHSVYVMPDYRRRGVYKKMYEFVKCEADSSGAKSVRLSVNTNNKAARNAYESLGMQQADLIIYSR